jgi:hypothetical protein
LTAKRELTSEGGMAISAKVNFIFNHARWGWTETYYYQSGSGSLTTAMADAILLAQLRAVMTSANVRLEAIRISDLTSKRNSKTIYQSTILAGVNTAASQEPWESALIDLTGVTADGNIYRRKLMLRGFPASWNTWTTTNLLNPTLVPAFAVALNAFFAVLAGTASTGTSPWCIRASDRSLVANPKYPITAINVIQPGGYFEITTNPAVTPALKIGDLVHVSGSRGSGTKGLNSDAYVTEVTGPVYKLSTRQKCVTQFVEVAGKPELYRRLMLLIPISGFGFERFVKRDTGRPFFGTAGRRAGSRC